MDLTGDGKDDIISGSWPGELYIFRGGDDRTFSAPEKIRDSGGKDIKVGSASAVFASDWDADGDLDLIVGNIDGEIYLIPNEGSPEEPNFGSPEKMKADGEAIKLTGRDSGPCVADWDGDGRKDLLSGSGDGSVVWFRNIGKEKKPELAAAEILVPRAGNHGRPDKGDRTRRPGTRTKLCVTDWNEDGRLDLLVGDFGYLPRELTEEQKKQAEEAQKELRELSKEYTKLFRAPDGETPEEKEEREAKKQEMMEKIRKLSTSIPRAMEYAGGVWVFLRKAPPKKDY